jgi:hypothetical protein
VLFILQVDVAMFPIFFNESIKCHSLLGLRSSHIAMFLPASVSAFSNTMWGRIWR